MKSLIRYFIKSPKGLRKTWSIVAYTNRPRTYVTLNKNIQDKVDAINAQFIKGVIDESISKTLLKEAINEEYRRVGVFHLALKHVGLSEENNKLLNEFWSEVYGAKALADEASAKSEFVRALRYIDPLSLYTTDAAAIKAKLKEKCNTSQHRRAISSLREILTYLKRDVILYKPEADLIEIKYLTKAEVEQLAKSAPNKMYRDLVYTKFGTGGRTGECMAMGPDSIVGERTIYIGKQVIRSGKTKAPKRGKKGKVTVISSMWSHVKRWTTYDKTNFDRFAFYHWIVSASMKLWPDNKSKHIYPHCLRHAHAIHLLGRGASLTLVSLNLRNRIEICQKYYAGFEHTSDTSDLLKKLI